MRKIEGDVERLRDEIREALELKAEHVVINRLTGHIIVKVCLCEMEKEAMGSVETVCCLIDC